MARLSWTSLSSAPSVPRSRVVVIPARSVAAAWLLQDLVVPQRLVVRVQKQVGVPFDQAGNEGRARQLHPLGARGVEPGDRPGCLDAVATHHHRPAALGRIAGAVPDGIGNEQRAVGGVGGDLRGRRSSRPGRQGDETQDEDARTARWTHAASGVGVSG